MPVDQVIGSTAVAGRRRSLPLRRRLFSLCGWVLTGLALSLLSAAMLWILVMVFVRGIGALSPRLFTTVTQGNGGGLLNAIEGTAVLSAGALLLAVPFGSAAGSYVSE
jgi:phosphate transport system permease protein